MQLQQTLGNQATLKFLRGAGIQPKLKIGPANDRFEQEADRVADAVLRMGDGVNAEPTAALGPLAGAGVQRKCAECDEDEETLRRKPMSAVGSSQNTGGAGEAAIAGLRSGGRPLTPEVRSYFEPRFGHDFSQVRIHTGPEASESAASINSRAFTYGSNIVFGAEEQQPESTPGRKLLAHELAHVVQQSNAARGHRLLPESQATQPLGGIPRAPASAPFSALGQASGPVIQRQGAQSTHTSPVVPSVPSEKWRSDVESAYRRAGNMEAANAVRACRESGECGHILTEREAWNAYRTGRITANLGAPPETGPGGSTAPSIAVAGVAAPAALAPSAVSGAQATAARTALQRAAVRWGTAAVLEGGAAADAGAGAAAATGTAAGVATVAVPIAIGVVITLAVIDLIGYAGFQSALRRLGYVILPEPLGACISGCHQPSAPPIREPFQFPSPEPLDPQLIEEWLRRETPAPRPTPGPGPVAPPFPFPEPRQRRRRRRNECFVTEAFPLGGNAEHDALAAFVTGQPVEYILSTPNGTMVARYDGKDAIDTLYEIKTRHDFLHLLDQPESRLGPRGRRAISEGVANIIFQLEHQATVAAVCGYEFRVATNNLGIVEILRELAPGVTVEFVEFPWP